MLNVKKTLTKILTIVKNNTGSEYFTLGSYSGFDSASGYGIYDKASNTVRLYMFGIDTANIPISTTLFTVPEEYRPTANIPGIAILSTDSTYGIVYYVTVGSDGTIKQNLTAYLRRVLAVCEYQLGGVIRTLKNAISNLYREGVATC